MPVAPANAVVCHAPTPRLGAVPTLLGANAFLGGLSAGIRAAASGRNSVQPFLLGALGGDSTSQLSGRRLDGPSGSRELKSVYGETGDGATSGSVVLVSDQAENPSATLVHEVVHARQFRFLQEAIGRPVKTAIRRHVSVARSLYQSGSSWESSSLVGTHGVAGLVTVAGAGASSHAVRDGVDRVSQIQLGGIRATLNRAWKMAPYRGNRLLVSTCSLGLGNDPVFGTEGTKRASTQLAELTRNPGALRRAGRG